MVRVSLSLVTGLNHAQNFFCDDFITHRCYMAGVDPYQGIILIEDMIQRMDVRIFRSFRLNALIDCGKKFFKRRIAFRISSHLPLFGGEGLIPQEEVRRQKEEKLEIILSAKRINDLVITEIILCDGLAQRSKVNSHGFVR